MFAVFLVLGESCMFAVFLCLVSCTCLLCFLRVCCEFLVFGEFGLLAVNFLCLVSSACLLCSLCLVSSVCLLCSLCFACFVFLYVW